MKIFEYQITSKFEVLSCEVSIRIILWGNKLNLLNVSCGEKLGNNNHEIGYHYNFVSLSNPQKLYDENKHVLQFAFRPTFLFLEIHHDFKNFLITFFENKLKYKD